MIFAIIAERTKVQFLMRSAIRLMIISTMTNIVIQVNINLISLRHIPQLTERQNRLSNNKRIKLSDR